MSENRAQRDQLDLELRQQLVAYLAELTGRVRAENVKKDDVATKSGWMRFWTWWRDYHPGFSALVTSLSIVIGGLWAINQFRAESREKREQESKQLQVQRNSIIAQYATQLGDPQLRNSAVYGLAVLAREDALPLLILQLKDSAQKVERQLLSLGESSRPLDVSAEADFQQALTQALLLIGEPALQPIVQLNREAGGASRRRSLHPGEVTLLRASQTILERLLPREMAGKGMPSLNLSGVYLRDAQFERVTWHSIELSGTHFVDVNLCRSQMPFARLEGSLWEEVILIGADLRGARLQGADFGNADLSDAVLDGADATRARLRKLHATSMVEAQLSYAQLKDADMDLANLQGARINNANLSGASLNSAVLREAILSNTLLLRANLENADLSDADLERTMLFESWEDQPGPSAAQHEPTSGFPFSGEGAFVLGAKLTNARNVSDPQRRYLCRWGALGVPGGCADTPRAPILTNLTKISHHRATSRFEEVFRCGGGGSF